MTNDNAPKPTGRRREIRLRRGLIPWRTDDDQPALIQAVGSDKVYLPVFSTEAQLRAFMTRAGAAFDKIKQIDDGEEFLRSVPDSVGVMMDAHYTPEGSTRYHEVLRD